MNTITTIESIFPAKKKDGSEVKGVNARTGNPWKLYKVKCADGVYYPIINPPAEIAKGKKVFIEFSKVKENGYENIKVSKMAVVEEKVVIDAGLPEEDITEEDLPF